MEKSAIIPVREKEPNISSIQCPMLTSVNYTAWAMRMKVALRVNKAWEAIDPGEADPIKNDVATAFLFQSIPENLVPQIGHLETAKDMWEAIKSRYLGADRVREARLQTLTSEFERLSMKESENIDEFAGRMSSLAAQSTSLGQVIDESKMVKKFLNGLPRNKYIQLVASLEQSLDLNKTGWKQESVKLFVDNQSAIALTKNPVFHGRSKHIHKKYHFIRECVENEQINVEFVSGEEQKADILTKPLARIKFEKMRSLIGVEDLNSGLGIKGVNVR